MTTRQMIVTLLRKFRVADNPRKFALYECAHENDEETCTLLSEFTSCNIELFFCLRVHKDFTKIVSIPYFRPLQRSGKWNSTLPRFTPMS
ncbi:hypothetical protein COOONC_12473 [Cooperia oncophora]